MHKILVLSAALSAILLPAIPAMAQDKSPPAQLDLNKEQLAKIQQINARYDAQVKAALVGDPKAASLMQADLKQIDAEKDPSKKKAAIAAYRARYAGTYKTALAKGKVNLNGWMSELRVVMPGYLFALKDGVYVLATAESDEPAVPPPPPEPTVTVENLRGADFTFTKVRGCGAVSGNTVSNSGMNITNETWAAEAGGCTNSGTLTYKLDVPHDKRARVVMRANMHVDVFAAGVVAVAMSSGSSAMRLQFPWDGYMANESHYCSVFVPFLWAAADSCGDSDARINKEIDASGQYSIVAETNTSVIAGGVVAASTASATVRDFSTRITVKPW